MPLTSKGYPCFMNEYTGKTTFNYPKMGYYYLIFALENSMATMDR